MAKREVLYKKRGVWLPIMIITITVILAIRHTK